MIRAVLDTNVFISSLFWRGVPYQIVQKGLGGSFLIVTSLEILEEIGETLRRKFRFPAEDTRAFLGIITVNSHLAEPQDKVEVVRADPPDNKIIECAVAGRAHFIVSGDRHLLDLRKHGGAKIVTAREFLSFL
ncbi:putative toxin-antitoxin system toxin component, PIN family [Candidatus Wolfebacteria bacterium]|nr:putative toxin-antitoxin system toxin component, PIN family [Candidatus Wolfebacteria bacterium]